MYCKFCGSKIDDNAIFCPECGQSLEHNSNIGKTATYKPITASSGLNNSVKFLTVVLGAFVSTVVSSALFALGYFCFPFASFIPGSIICFALALFLIALAKNIADKNSGTERPKNECIVLSLIALDSVISIIYAFLMFFECEYSGAPVPWGVAFSVLALFLVAVCVRLMIKQYGIEYKDDKKRSALLFLIIFFAIVNIIFCLLLFGEDDFRFGYSQDFMRMGFLCLAVTFSLFCVAVIISVKQSGIWILLLPIFLLVFGCIVGGVILLSVFNFHIFWSNNYMWLSFLCFVIALSLIIVIGLMVKKFGVWYELYENRIVGIAVVKGADTKKVRIDIALNDIKSVAVEKNRIEITVNNYNGLTFIVYAKSKYEALLFEKTIKNKITPEPIVF